MHGKLVGRSAPRSCGTAGVSTRCARPRDATALRVTHRPPRGSDGSYGPCGPAWTGRPGRPRRSRDAADCRIRGWRAPDRNRLGSASPAATARRAWLLAERMLVATVNFPFVATENRTLCWLAVAGLRSTLLSKPTARRQVADARMGDEDAAEALSGTGRLEGGVGEALRGESPDAPRVDRVEPVGPGPVVRGRTVFAAAARTAQAGPLRRDHRFPSRGVPRAVSEAAVRRGPRGWLRR